MTESEVLKIFENEVIILECWIEHCKDIIADCETEDDEFDDDKERAELSLKDYTERKEAFDVAISALKEIQLYKDNKLCLVPEDVYSRQCSELDAYKEIGTVEECRECAGDCRDGGRGIMILTFILGLIGGAAAGIAMMALVAMAKDREE